MWTCYVTFSGGVDSLAKLRVLAFDKERNFQGYFNKLHIQTKLSVEDDNSNSFFFRYVFDIIRYYDCN